MKTNDRRNHWDFSTTSHKVKSFVAWLISLSLTFLLLYYFTDLKKLF
jgi:hypothetical protein